MIVQYYIVNSDKRKEDCERLQQTNTKSKNFAQITTAPAQSFGDYKRPPAPISLDQTDLKILGILQDNCQLSYRKLGTILGMSGVIVASRIKTLEEKGILRGYSVVLDPVKLGYDLTAILYVQVEGGFLLDVEAELSRTSGVIGVYEVTGDFDVIAVAKLRDRDCLNVLIKNLLLTPHVKRTLTNITLNIVKEDFKIPI
ncbi:MAG: Lrp/AsnC family transcriptional regulator [Candidatus Bathyarchaeia archaeon]